MSRTSDHSLALPRQFAGPALARPAALAAAALAALLLGGCTVGPDYHFRLRGLQARIAIVEQQIEADRHLFSLVRDRVGNGVATRREQAEAEARLAQTRSPLAAERARQANRLDILMGAAPGTYAAQLGAPGADCAVPGLPAGIGPDTLIRGEIFPRV